MVLMVFDTIVLREIKRIDFSSEIKKNTKRFQTPRANMQAQPIPEEFAVSFLSPQYYGPKVVRNIFKSPWIEFEHSRAARLQRVQEMISALKSELQTCATALKATNSRAKLRTMETCLEKTLRRLAHVRPDDDIVGRDVAWMSNWVDCRDMQDAAECNSTHGCKWSTTHGSEGSCDARWLNWMRSHRSSSSNRYRM